MSHTPLLTLILPLKVFLPAFLLCAVRVFYRSRYAAVMGTLTFDCLIPTGISLHLEMIHLLAHRIIFVVPYHTSHQVFIRVIRASAVNISCIKAALALVHALGRLECPLQVALSYLRHHHQLLSLLTHHTLPRYLHLPPLLVTY